MKKIAIVGNGRSLKGFDLTKISKAGLDSFGMNAAYRYWRRIDWWPTYFACYDFVVIDSHLEEFKKLITDPEIPIEKFFFRHQIVEHPKCVAVSNEEIGKIITTGTGVCRTAIKMGYDTLFLLGIDCNYVETIPESKQTENNVLEVQQTPKHNPNYFFDDYQQKGDVYNVPNCEKIHMEAWSELAEDCNKLGVDIINCNPKSNVKCFKFQDVGQFTI